MSNQCSQCHELWTWITTSKNSGRLQVTRDPKRTKKSRLYLDLTFRGDSLAIKPQRYNNDTEELCQSSWKNCFGEVTKGSQWSQQRTGMWETVTLAWTLSALPAYVWQMQQIKPYLLLLGIKQNNASKYSHEKLAAVVSCVGKKNMYGKPEECIVYCFKNRFF